MRAKKSFGQHFLINENLAESIVNSIIDKADGKKIIEVGPGKGVLTKYLIGQDLDFLAIDADRDMIEYLCTNYPKNEEQFLLENFLKHDLSQYDDLAVLGNFPYNISSQIVFKIIENKEKVAVSVGMFQKEVANRIVSLHGSKVYGVISILIQVYYNVKIIYRVAPGSFSPPPKVDSAVVLFERKEEIDDSLNYALLKAIVKVSFGQRRKMLRNTLKPFIKDEKLLKDDYFTQRPEQLSVNDFLELTKRIETQNNYEFK